MNYSISTEVTKDQDACAIVAAKFREMYPNPAPGVQEHFDAAAKAIDDLEKLFAGEGEKIHVSLSGHAHQGNDSLSMFRLSVRASK